MSNHNRQKFSWLIGVLIVLLAGSLAVKFAYKQPVQKADERTTDSRNHLPATTVPPHIPADFPGLESGTVSYNYSLPTEGNKTQGVRSIQNTTSLDENYKLYTQYFKGNGWQTTATIDEKTTKLVSAYKGDTFISVSIKPGAENKGSSIEITAYTK